MTAYVPPSDMPDADRPRNIVGVAAIVIVFLAVLVATASYFAGRAVRPGEDARARVTVPEPAVAAAATPAVQPEPARPTSPFTEFNLAQLHPQVAEAVAQARLVQEEAMAAALRGEAAARRARAGSPGASVIMMDSGDVYAGEAVGGRAQGAGVYTWSNPQEEDYAGDFVDGEMDGLGIKRWTDGALHFGARRREAREGFGVFVDSTGGGYEGAWSNGAPDGWGVRWNANGTVHSQGRWSGNTLVEAFIIPTPLPTADPAGGAAGATPGTATLADGVGIDTSAVDGAPLASELSEVAEDAAAVDGDDAEAAPVVDDAPTAAEPVGETDAEADAVGETAEP